MEPKTNNMLEKIDEMILADTTYPVDFDAAWQWIGYTRKDNALTALAANFTDGEDFCSGLNRSKTKKGKTSEVGTELDSCLNRNQTEEFSCLNRKTQQEEEKEFSRLTWKTQQEAEKEFSKINGKTPGKRPGGRPNTYYRLTADCFKAFCMMAGTEKGKEVRKYFIEAEKRLKQVVSDRRLSKAMRRDLTDAIKESTLNDSMHGFAYKQFTDLVYRAVIGMTAKQFREERGLDKDAIIRGYLTQLQITTVAKLEKMVASLVDMGADYGKVKAVIDALGMPRIESYLMARLPPPIDKGGEDNGSSTQ